MRLKLERNRWKISFAAFELFYSDWGNLLEEKWLFAGEIFKLDKTNAARNSHEVQLKTTKADFATLWLFTFQLSTALLENLHKNSILVVCETREQRTSCDWIEKDRSEFLSKHQVEQREIIAYRIKKFMTISLKLEVAAISSQVRNSVQRKMNSLFISRSETMIEWEEGIQTLNIFSAAEINKRRRCDLGPIFCIFCTHSFGLRRWKISETLDQTKVICDYRNFLPFSTIFESSSIRCMHSAATEAACNRPKCTVFIDLPYFLSDEITTCAMTTAIFIIGKSLQLSNWCICKSHGTSCLELELCAASVL